MRRAFWIGFVVWLVGFVLAALWIDAMDSRYGVRSGMDRGWGTVTGVAIVWPITLPFAMAALAINKSRWPIQKASK